MYNVFQDRHSFLSEDVYGEFVFQNSFETIFSLVSQRYISM